MRAVCWEGTKKINVRNVPDPAIEDARDAILKITSTAICGSDLHLYDGVIPMMKDGDIVGHEFMGEVVELGRGVHNLKVGDRVVVPFTISCGSCSFCESQLWSLCDNSNRTADVAEKLNGYSTSGMFGYSHIYGGYPGGQAEYVRVPYADVGPLKITSDISDEKVLFLSDIFPTGWMAAKNAQIRPGDTVAIWGCGPVGQFAIQSAWLQGAGRVIAIDSTPERLEMARTYGKAETINFKEEKDVLDALKEMTRGRGPDSCIDAVGMEGHGTGALAKLEQLEQKIGIATDIPYVLRQTIMACRKGGTVSIVGVYGAMLDHLPIGAAFAKGLTFRMGQANVQTYMPELLSLIESGKIDPSFVITHRLPLAEASSAYEMFSKKDDNCIKVVLKP